MVVVVSPASVARSFRWRFVHAVARLARSSSWVTCVARDAWFMGSGRKVAVHKVSVAWRLAFIFTFILAWIITPAWLRPRADLRILLAMPVMTVVMMVNWMLVVVA